jgi:hypothetical protein
MIESEAVTDQIDIPRDPGQLEVSFQNSKWSGTPYRNLRRASATASLYSLLEQTSSSKTNALPATFSFFYRLRTLTEQIIPPLLNAKLLQPESSLFCVLHRGARCAAGCLHWPSSDTSRLQHSAMKLNWYVFRYWPSGLSNENPETRRCASPTMFRHVRQEVLGRPCRPLHPSQIPPERHRRRQ